MQIKIFTVPIGDSGKSVDDMNKFMRLNKVLSVEKHLINNSTGVFWCFCVEYIENEFVYNKNKKDYKAILGDELFVKFLKLREMRKEISEKEGIPPFMVFSDDEIAEISKLDKITNKALLGIKGIGDKKVEKYAVLIKENLREFRTDLITPEMINEFDEKTKKEILF